MIGASDAIVERILIINQVRIGRLRGFLKNSHPFKILKETHKKRIRRKKTQRDVALLISYIPTMFLSKYKGTITREPIVTIFIKDSKNLIIFHKFLKNVIMIIEKIKKIIHI